MTRPFASSVPELPAGPWPGDCWRLGWSALLVESGGRDFETRIQDLAAGGEIGHPYYDLDSVSLRMLGGTTAIWGGRCAELDPVDFETRAWVPHSGWPFGLAELRPYYDQALKIFQVPAPAADRRSMADCLPLLQSLDRDDLAVGFWSFDDVADRFAAPRIGDVLNHPRCRVLTHATVTALHLDPGASFVSSATIRDVSGKCATVTARHFVLALNEATHPLRPWLAIKSGQAEVAVIVRAEQAPNPDSRVTLADERDALGMPRTLLDWNFTALDKHSVRSLVEALGTALTRDNLGELGPADWLGESGPLWHTDLKISAHPIGGYHHMGTTRMADDPARGVVDRHGRVHGVANLHIAGSSVFPTGGWANPTLTIAALALRLGDRFGPFA